MCYFYKYSYSSQEKKEKGVQAYRPQALLLFDIKTHNEWKISIKTQTNNEFNKGLYFKRARISIKIMESECPCCVQILFQMSTKNHLILCRGLREAANTICGLLYSM